LSGANVTITELGAIGEFIASIAVLITLVVLVFEMRNNTKILVRSNARATYDQEGEALRALLDGEVAELYLRGHNEGLDALTPVERYRFDLALVIWLHAVESAYADHKDGFYPADKLVPFDNAIPGFLTTPGGAVWWSERQFWFGPEFRSVVDGLLENASEDALHAGPKPNKGGS
jgi:hypothetical protein